MNLNQILICNVVMVGAQENTRGCLFFWVTCHRCIDFTRDKRFKKSYLTYNPMRSVAE